MLALLPPSSSVTRLTCAAAPAITRVPTSVDPVNTILRTSGWVTNRSPTTEPLPGSTWNRSAGRPASTASSPSRIVVSGVHSAGLTSTALPAASAGAKPHDAIGHREVPRGDDADDAERLVEGDVQAAGHRNLLAGQPFRASRSRTAARRGRGRPPTRALPIGCPELATSSAASSSTCASTDRGERAQRGGPLGGGQPRPIPLCRLGARHRVVDAGLVGLLDGAQHLLGGRVDHFAERAHCRGHLFPSHTAARGLDHRGEQPKVVEPLLGMPLHRQNEVRRRAISTASMTPSESCALTIRPVAEPVDGLVVVALRIRRFADQRGQPGAGHRAHRRRGEHRVALLVAGVADHIGQMLVQRAAQRDVDHLRAAADAQHRHAAPDRAVDQRELPGVALPVVGTGSSVAGCALLPVARPGRRRVRR